MDSGEARRLGLVFAVAIGVASGCSSEPAFTPAEVEAIVRNADPEASEVQVTCQVERILEDFSRDELKELKAGYGGTAEDIAGLDLQLVARVLTVGAQCQVAANR